jgi:hypothetical protein
LALAAFKKPSLSNPAGMPQVCEPIRPEPIMEPPCGVASKPPSPLRSNGRADASLPTWSGL